MSVLTRSKLLGVYNVRVWSRDRLHLFGATAACLHSRGALDVQDERRRLSDHDISIKWAAGERLPVFALLRYVYYNVYNHLP